MAMVDAQRLPANDARIGGFSEFAIVAVVLLLHVVAWTTFATLSHAVVHHDMTEAFAWGQEWRAGYSKHPPFYAWMAAAWFYILPRESWAFYVLSEANAALGLLGAWAIARRLLPRREPNRTPNLEALAVLAMLLLTPLYGLAAMKFNANTALLSLWPWTTYALIRLLEQPRGIAGVLWGVAFGLLAAASVLTKYYSGLLLVACLAAALMHPNLRAAVRSPGPYLAVLAGGIAIAPHLAWLVGSGYQTLEYAAATTKHPFLAVLSRGAGAIAQAVAVHVLPLAVLIWSLPAERRAGFWRRVGEGLRDRSLRWVWVLAFGPFVLSFLALAMANVRISAQFMIPIFYMVPTAVLLASGDRISRPSLKRIAVPALVVCLIGLIAGPLGAIIYFKSKATIALEPRADVARQVTQAWHDAFGTRLDIVSGDETYSQAAAFYSPDRPSDFTAFNIAQAPWITRERLASSGFAIICQASQDNCLSPAASWTTQASRRIEFNVVPRLLWMSAPPRRFVVFLVPPAAIAR